MGVCHADDLIYLWNPVFGRGELPLSEEEISVRELMTSAWVNFAIYGEPTPNGSSLSWTPVKLSGNHQIWNISDPWPTMTAPTDLWERMKLWDEVMEM